MEFLYLGGANSIEAQLADRFGIPFRAVQSGSLRGQKPWTVLRNSLKIAFGAGQAYATLSRFRPDVILVTGGYMSVPVVLAGYVKRIPILIYLPDIVPGLAIKRLSRWASRVAVSFAETTAAFAAGKAIVTGYPVRREFFEADRKQARERLQLAQDSPVVMIYGGSRGAHSINVAVAQQLPALLRKAQMVHVCGREDIDEAEANKGALPTLLQDRYHPFAYLHEEMIDTLAAADLVVARAGASILGEFPALGLPSVLIPYPYAGQHQEANADYMVRHGAAVKLQDRDLCEQLLPTVAGLLQDSKRLSAMRNCAQQLSNAGAASRIVRELQILAGA